ncbi:nuclear transport factor 2 family protein [Persicitalea sp.]|uniref:nuclear transport factor 2 family protein n=1 Tax=Persicitalea sp. TaxID=3100273 RepID=UPI00359430A8
MKIKQFTSVLAAFAALFLFVAGCNTSANESAAKTTDVSEMTAEQKQTIEKEISALTTAFFQDVEKLDIEACMNYFENTPEFLAVNPDGTAGDYDSLKKLNADAFDQFATMAVTPKREVIRVLSDTQVLYTVFATMNFTLKTGEKMKLEEAGTMLFTKIDGAWKATFYHESAASPVAVE